MTDLEKLSKFSQEDVWHEISRYCHRQTSTPKLYLIGGQPGAGKSTTINDCIAINLDDCCSMPSSIQNFSNR
jgi:zeta toxin superfamily